MVPQPQGRSFLSMRRTWTAEKCREMKNARTKCANLFFFVLIVKCAYLRRFFFFLFFSVAVVIMVTLGFLNFGAFSTCHSWDQFWLVPIVCFLQLTDSVRRDGRINARGEKKRHTPAAVCSLRSNQVQTYDIKTIYLHSSSFNNRIAFMRAHLMLT